MTSTSAGIIVSRMKKIPQQAPEQKLFVFKCTTLTKIFSCEMLL